MKTITSKAMSLKGNIKNLAKEKKVLPQYQFEKKLAKNYNKK